MRGGLAGLERLATALLRGALGIGLLLMVALNVANALGRYGGLPVLPGADELLVFSMIWIVMLGAILATREGGHLSIDLLAQRLPGRSRRFLATLLGAITALVSGFIAVHSLTFVERIAAIGQTSMGLGVPMIVPHAAVTLGFAGIAIVSALMVLADLRRAFIGGAG